MNCFFSILLLDYYTTSVLVVPIGFIYYNYRTESGVGAWFENLTDDQVGYLNSVKDALGENSAVFSSLYQIVHDLKRERFFPLCLGTEFISSSIFLNLCFLISLECDII